MILIELEVQEALRGIELPSLELLPDLLFCVTPLRLWCMASSTAHQRRATLVGVWTSRHKRSCRPLVGVMWTYLNIWTSSPQFDRLTLTKRSGFCIHSFLLIYLQTGPLSSTFGWLVPRSFTLHRQRCLGLTAWLGSQKISKVCLSVFQLPMEDKKSRWECCNPCGTTNPWSLSPKAGETKFSVETNYRQRWRRTAGHKLWDTWTCHCILHPGLVLLVIPECNQHCIVINLVCSFNFRKHIPKASLHLQKFHRPQVSPVALPAVDRGSVHIRFVFREPVLPAWLKPALRDTEEPHLFFFFFGSKVLCRLLWKLNRCI